MLPRRKFAVFCGLLGLMVLPARALTLFKDPQFKVKVVRNVQFGTGDIRQPNPAKRPLLLDVYQPESSDAPEKRPAMIAIHGGGFLFGDKSEMTNLCRELAARGYACFSINYRLVPDAPRGSCSDALAVSAVSGAPGARLRSGA